jgi:tRNA threonylcarbamoyladenosine biosynthesis protein TsaE
MSGSGEALRVVDAGPDDAEPVLEVIRRAFTARPALVPPSTALEETEQSVQAVLSAAGGLLVLRRDRPVGALLFDDSRTGLLGLRRVSVDPAHQSHGVASAMVGVAEDVAAHRNLDGVWLQARLELPETLSFWRRRGYVELTRNGPMLELGKALWLASSLPTAEATERFGRQLAGLLRAGDVVLLDGELGAGKTTLARGLGAGLGVRGEVTSPTFVLARVHPARGDGPALVHVDAYRLDGAAELDDLDLDETQEHAVTVVEWGAGLSEELADSWLEVRLERWSEGGEAALASAGPDRAATSVEPSPDGRVVSVRPRGPRWVGAPLRSRLLGSAPPPNQPPATNLMAGYT